MADVKQQALPWGNPSVLTVMAERQCSWADFSPCGRYRYTLGRRWSDGPLMGWIGMNPSVAGVDREDATSRRFRSFAEREGFGAYEAVNLDALVATDPGELRRSARQGLDVTGPGCDQALVSLAKRARVLVACWGTGGDHRPDRVKAVLALVRDAGASLMCLGMTNGGHPRHPLYIRADKALEPFGVEPVEGE